MPDTKSQLAEKTSDDNRSYEPVHSAPVQQSPRPATQDASAATNPVTESTNKP